MGAFRAASTEKANALRANRAVTVGAFRDVRTEKAGVFTIRADQTEKGMLSELIELKQ